MDPTTFAAPRPPRLPERLPTLSLSLLLVAAASVLWGCSGRLTPVSRDAQAAARRRRCGWLLPILVGAAFLGEIAFLGRLDIAKNAAAVESWTTSFYRRSAPWSAGAAPGGDDDSGEIRRCEERLERKDAVPYDRNFERDPVLVGGATKVWCTCAPSPYQFLLHELPIYSSSSSGGGGEKRGVIPAGDGKGKKQVVFFDEAPSVSQQSGSGGSSAASPARRRAAGG